MRRLHWAGVAALLIAVIVALSISYPAVLLAILGMQLPLLAGVLVHGERLRLFASRKISLSVALKGNSIALFSALVVPGRVTELLKPLYFRFGGGLPLNAGVTVLILERLLDVIAVALLMLAAVYAAPAADTHLVEAGRWIALVALAACIGLVGALLLYPAHLLWLINRIPVANARAWFTETVDRLTSSVQPAAWPAHLALTAIAWASSVACYWTFFQLDGGPDLGWIDSLVVFVVGALGLVVTVTPGGLGTFEAAVAFTLVHYGYTVDQALATAVGLRIGSYLPHGLLTVYAVAADGFDLARARQSAETARPD